MSHVFYLVYSNVILPSSLHTECTMYSTLVSANCFKCAFINKCYLLYLLLLV